MDEVLNEVCAYLHKLEEFQDDISIDAILPIFTKYITSHGTTEIGADLTCRLQLLLFIDNLFDRSILSSTEKLIPRLFALSSTFPIIPQDELFILYSTANEHSSFLHGERTDDLIQPSFKSVTNFQRILSLHILPVMKLLVLEEDPRLASLASSLAYQWAYHSRSKNTTSTHFSDTILLPLFSYLNQFVMTGDGLLAKSAYIHDNHGLLIENQPGHDENTIPRELNAMVLCSSESTQQQKEQSQQSHQSQQKQLQPIETSGEVECIAPIPFPIPVEPNSEPNSDSSSTSIQVPSVYVTPSNMNLGIFCHDENLSSSLSLSLSAIPPVGRQKEKWIQHEFHRLNEGIESERTNARIHRSMKLEASLNPEITTSTNPTNANTNVNTKANTSQNKDRDIRRDQRAPTPSTQSTKTDLFSEAHQDWATLTTPVTPLPITTSLRIFGLAGEPEDNSFHDDDHTITGQSQSQSAQSAQSAQSHVAPSPFVGNPIGSPFSELAHEHELLVAKYLHSQRKRSRAFHQSNTNTNTNTNAASAQDQKSPSHETTRLLRTLRRNILLGIFRLPNSEAGVWDPLLGSKGYGGVSELAGPVLSLRSAVNQPAPSRPNNVNPSEVQTQITQTQIQTQPKVDLADVTMQKYRHEVLQFATLTPSEDMIEEKNTNDMNDAVLSAKTPKTTETIETPSNKPTAPNTNTPPSKNTPFEDVFPFPVPLRTHTSLDQQTANMLPELTAQYFNPEKAGAMPSVLLDLDSLTMKDTKAATCLHRAAVALAFAMYHLDTTQTCDKSNDSSHHSTLNVLQHLIPSVQFLQSSNDVSLGFANSNEEEQLHTAVADIANVADGDVDADADTDVSSMTDKTHDKIHDVESTKATDEKSLSTKPSASASTSATRFLSKNSFPDYPFWRESSFLGSEPLWYESTQGIVVDSYEFDQKTPFFSRTGELQHPATYLAPPTMYSLESIVTDKPICSTIPLGKLGKDKVCEEGHPSPNDESSLMDLCSAFHGFGQSPTLISNSSLGLRFDLDLNPSPADVASKMDTFLKRYESFCYLSTVLHHVSHPSQSKKTDLWNVRLQESFDSLKQQFKQRRESYNETDIIDLVFRRVMCQSLHLHSQAESAFTYLQTTLSSSLCDFDRLRKLVKGLTEMGVKVGVTSSDHIALLSSKALLLNLVPWVSSQSIISTYSGSGPLPSAAFTGLQSPHIPVEVVSSFWADLQRDITQKNSTACQPLQAGRLAMVNKATKSIALNLYLSDASILASTASLGAKSSDVGISPLVKISQSLTAPEAQWTWNSSIHNIGKSTADNTSIESGKCQNALSIWRNLNGGVGHVVVLGSFKTGPSQVSGRFLSDFPWVELAGRKEPVSSSLAFASSFDFVDPKKGSKSIPKTLVRSFLGENLSSLRQSALQDSSCDYEISSSFTPVNVSISDDFAAVVRSLQSMYLLSVSSFNETK